MAESGEEEMASSWWGGWLQTAKDKSMAALDMVRKDLTEFGTTMQNDAGHVVEMTSTTLKDSLKTENTSAAKDKLTKGLNTVLERLSQALVVPPDDEGQIPITASSAELYDRTKARIHTIQLDPGTYLNQPSGAQETYGMWCEGFELEDCQGHISDVLVAKAEVRALYTKLVPSKVSHVDFWRRYFYKLHQMDVEQARKEALMKRADSAGAEDSISWDDDWSGDEAAAEDSGSDWEKLPRPSQHRRSPSPSPTKPPPPPPPPPSTTTPSQQTKDSQNMPPSAEIPPVEATSQPERGGKQEEKEEEEESEQSQAPSVSGAGQGRVSSAGTPPPVETAAAAVVAVIPCQQSTAVGSPPSQQSTDTFKDYLQLAAHDGTAAEAAAEWDSDEGRSASPAASEDKESLGDVETCGPSLPESSDVPPLPPPSALRVSPPVDSVPDSSFQAEAEAAELSADGQAAGPAEGVVKGVGEEKNSVGQEALSVMVEGEGAEGSLRTTERGDLVVVGSDHGSPVSNTSGSKGLSDEDWEQDLDLDLELTEEDMKEVEDLAQKLGDNINLEDDDWENWE